MYKITKENIISYMKKNLPNFDDTVPAQVSILGEDPTADEGERDGHVNIVLKVKTPVKSYILKQGLDEPRNLRQGVKVASYRNETECNTMNILHSIVPEYVPEILFQDKENHIFIMEFIENLKAVRFQLIKENQIPDLGVIVGDFLAKSSFYTSEYYLDRSTFRKMQSKFENTELRQIMEDGMFLNRFGTDLEEDTYHDWERFRPISDDPACQTNRLSLRRTFMTHSDCLIHSDFHTSNVCLSDEGIKMLDFEFSFMGPFGYDMGYFAGSLIAAYCAACFKEYSSEQDKTQCKAYLLSTLKLLFETYDRTFKECWERDAKAEYKGQEGFLKIIQKEMLQNAAGFAAITNWCRTTDLGSLPEYHSISSEKNRKFSMAMAVLMDHEVLLQRETFETVDDYIDLIIHFEKTFIFKSKGEDK
ncbi:MAG: phosphotransferase [Lachnospiraceae bacterium]|nr:phosphotransferase [Lachnospiraceae bacterium]